MAVHSVCWRWALHDNAECKQSFLESVSSPVLFSSPCCSLTQHHDRHAHKPTHPRRRRKRRGRQRQGCRQGETQTRSAGFGTECDAVGSPVVCCVLWCRQLLPQLDRLALFRRPCDFPCLIAVDSVFVPGFFHTRFKMDGVVGTPA